MNKVNVTTVADVTIKRFRWWSDWIDICVFNYGNCGYLLQMKVSRTNRKTFRTASLKGINGNALISEVGNLTQMSNQYETSS